MPEQIRLTWYVKHQHTETFDADTFARWVEDARLDIEDPTDLDEVYNALERGDWRAEEALFDLARPSNWLDSSSAEIADLSSEATAEAAS